MSVLGIEVERKSSGEIWTQIISITADFGIQQLAHIPRIALACSLLQDQQGTSLYISPWLYDAAQVWI